MSHLLASSPISTQAIQLVGQTSGYFERISNHTAREILRWPSGAIPNRYLPFFAPKIKRLQKQLYLAYHVDSFWGDQLLIAVYVPYIQTTLRGRVSRSSEQDISPVLIKLSHDARTAGSTVFNILNYNHDDEISMEDERSLCTLGQTYRGEARLQPLTSCKKVNFHGNSEGVCLSY